MAIKVTIDALRSAISKAQTKAEDAQASDRDQRILDSQVTAANARVKNAEASVTMAQMTKQEAEDKLSPPPTKQITGDGKKGGTKTVVDEREKDKLQAQVRAAETQIQQAQSSVEDARAEAERLTAESLSGAGISDSQQEAMGELSDLVAQLVAKANDSTTDLEGDDFQTKLKSAVDQSNQLAEDLPDAASEALKEFWEEITEGFDTIEEKFIKATTPPAYEIPANDDDNNYAQFFQDFNGEMTKLIDRLGPDGGDSDELDDPTGSILITLRNARTRLMSNSGNFLQGLDDNDTEKLTALMDKVRGMNNNLDRDREVTGTDFSSLINSTNAFSAILENGGGLFETVLNVQFDSIAQSATVIRSNLGDNQELTDLMTKLNRIKDPEQYLGLLATDFNELTNIQSRFSDAADAGTSLSVQDLTTLITDTNTLADRLIEDYDLNQTNTSSGNSGSSGQSGGSSNRRFRSTAPSRATVGGRG